MSKASEGTPTPNSGGKSQTPASTGTLALLTASALGSLIGSRLGPVPLALAAGATALALMNRKKQAVAGAAAEPTASLPPAPTFPASSAGAALRLPTPAAAAFPFPPAPPAQPAAPSSVDPLIQKWLASQLEREKLADETASSLEELPPEPSQAQGSIPTFPEQLASPPPAAEKSAAPSSDLEDAEYQPEPLLEDPVSDTPLPSPWKSPSFAELTEPKLTAAKAAGEELAEKPAQPWPPSTLSSTFPESSKALPASMLPDPPPWAAWFKDNAEPALASTTPARAVEPPAPAAPASVEPNHTPSPATPAVKSSSWAEIAAAAGLVQTPAVPLFKTLPTEQTSPPPVSPPAPAAVVPPPATTLPTPPTREAPEPFRSAFSSGSGQPAPALGQTPIAGIEPLPSWTEPKPAASGTDSSLAAPSSAAPEPFRAMPPLAARPAPLSKAASTAVAETGFNLESLFSAPPATPPSALAASSSPPAVTAAPTGQEAPLPVKTAPTGPLGPVAEANAPFFNAELGAGLPQQHASPSSHAEVSASKEAAEPPPAVEDAMAAFFRTPAVPTSASVSGIESQGVPPPSEAAEPPARDIDVHVAAPGEAWFDSPLATLPNNPWLTPKVAEEAPLASSLPPQSTAAPASSNGVPPVLDADMVLRPRAPVQSSVKPRSLHPTPIPKGTPPLPDDKTPGSTAPLQLPPEPPREERPRNSSWRSWWRGD